MIYIILPVHNRRETTEKFIKSLVLQRFKDFKLILVDDGSTDGTVDMVISYLPESVILKGDGNLWWGGGLQKGYEWIIAHTNDEDICLLINDDTVFDNDFLSVGNEFIENNNKTLVLAQCFSQKTKKLLDAGVYADLKKLSFRSAESKEEINCLSTRGLFLKVRDFKEIGGFYPKALPHYLSDYEFTIRAHKKGFTLTTEERLKLFVDEETTGLHKIDIIGIKDYWSKYFSNRNSSNPFHWIVFTWLAVPFPYKIYHFSRHMYRILKAIARPILVKIKN